MSDVKTIQELLTPKKTMDKDISQSSCIIFLTGGRGDDAGGRQTTPPPCSCSTHQSLHGATRLRSNSRTLHPRVSVCLLVCGSLIALVSLSVLTNLMLLCREAGTERRVYDAIISSLQAGSNPPYLQNFRDEVDDLPLERERRNADNARRRRRRRDRQRNRRNRRNSSAERPRNTDDVGPVYVHLPGLSADAAMEENYILWNPPESLEGTALLSLQPSTLVAGANVGINIERQGLYLVYSQVAVRGRSHGYSISHNCAHTTELFRDNRPRMLLKSLLTQNNLGLAQPFSNIGRHMHPLDSKLHMGVFKLYPGDTIKVRASQGCEQYTYFTTRDNSYLGVVKLF